MRKIKKINGFLVVKFNDREKREYEGTALGEYGVIDAEVYTGNLDIDRGAMEYDDADTLEVAVELARGLESEEDITDEPPTYTAAVETNESYTEETVEPAALIEGWTRRLATQVKSKHYPDTDPRTAAHELYGFKMALHQIGFLPESEVITDPDTFGAGRLDGPMPRSPEELLAFVCDERCKNRAGHTQEELDAICAKCPLGQLYEDAEAQGLRIRERSERALREHIEGVRHAEDTLTALLGGHEALAYLAALRDGQILQENECEHYAAQIAEAGAAWETVLEGVSFEDLSRLRHLPREVDEHTKDGGELFNGFQHETERIPAHRLEELHQLGTALLGECPENDCTIYRNVFRMAVDVDGQMGKLTGHARETMQREYERLLRELNRLYTMNHAVKKYVYDMEGKKICEAVSAELLAFGPHCSQAALEKHLRDQKRNEREVREYLEERVRPYELRLEDGARPSDAVGMIDLTIKATPSQKLVSLPKDRMFRSEQASKTSRKKATDDTFLNAKGDKALSLLRAMNE